MPLSNVEIRDERTGEQDAIRQVHLQAFGGNAEPRLVELLRERGKALISLVAEIRGEVVGHVLFSPVTITGAPMNVRALGMGPVAILPGFQGRGIGSRLIREGLNCCQRASYDLVVVLGNPKYYERFGFQPAHRHGFDNEYDVIDEFMVLELRDRVLETVKGLVQYAPEFKEVGC